MVILSLYKRGGLSDEKKSSLMLLLRDICNNVEIITVDAELCYLIETTKESDLDSENLYWLLSPSFHQNCLSTSTHFKENDSRKQMVIEIGPR